MRIFSGDNKVVDSPASNPGLMSPSNFGGDFGSRLKVNVTSKKKLNDSSPTSPMESSPVSPELVPILTLLNAHTHRRYHEGVFLILQDLNNNGTHAARKWKDVYGVLLGTQLALWDAKELAEFTDPSCPVSEKKLKEVASKPTYINLTDATLRTLDNSDNIVMECGKNLTNALVVSTTLKNRYFLQFGNKESFNAWNSAIRLCLYECSSLQEAYTGAFISSRGAKLGDIRILLTSRKYDYKDWVSVRFGAGMPWKRCYAVISQSSSKKKGHFGEINLYENDKKVKKNHAMATIVEAKALYAVYPSSPKLIDSSTIIKVVGSVKFEKKESAQEKDVFIMPEKHQAVPSYDTIIRFLIPAMDTFKLYGRPEKLLSSKNDPHSLLFGLPVLPHIYYLEVEDLLPLTNSVSSLHWSNNEWKEHISDILQRKIAQGYCGCNSTSNITSPLPSPFLGSADLFERADGVLSPKLSYGSKSSSNNSSKNSLPKRERVKLSSSSEQDLNNSDSPSIKRKSPPLVISESPHKVHTPTDASFRTRVTEGSPYAKQRHPKPFASSVNDSPSDRAKSRTVPYNNNDRKATTPEKFERGETSCGKNVDESLEKVRNMKLEIPESNFDKFMTDKNLLSVDSKCSNEKKLSVESDLSAIYEKYSNGPFGHTEGLNGSSDETYLRFQRAPVHSESNYNSRKSFTPSDFSNGNEEEHAVLQELNSLTQRINELGMESINSDSDSDRINGSYSQVDFGNNNDEDDMNLFDPDFMAQDQLRAEERDYNKDDRTPLAKVPAAFQSTGLGITPDDDIERQYITEHRSRHEVPKRSPEKPSNPLEIGNPYAKPGTRLNTTHTHSKTDRSITPQRGQPVPSGQQISSYVQPANINSPNKMYGANNSAMGSPRNPKTRAPPGPYNQGWNNRPSPSNIYQRPHPSDTQPQAYHLPGNPYSTGNRPNMQAQYHPQQVPMPIPQQPNRPYQPYAMNTHMGSPGGYAGAAPPFQPANVNYNTRPQQPWPTPNSPSAHYRPPPNLNQPQNGSAGYYRPPAPQLQNSQARPQKKDGFSQFMPSATTKNPYAQ
ncbi:AEL_HP2_G0041920.mRNA.1.CDS.1 [Saccharomyces cerevisiae]|nr:AEL_HP2_G0041920.mRNA.1.CDS.1 [Saccharomyces cerevisiae]CAI6679377.1 AEL_HP2_G0041920.mRNA.1.CDS.1 [Saccharomyces cerevisiae]CAI6725033.1 AEL_HP1_G0044040.mRNA.1.CDS.1 [Saccharomyces cerevisiae]